MIYFKINKHHFTENQIKELNSHYPFIKAKVLKRIIKNQLNTVLKDYPNIDLVISFKITKKGRCLGRFYPTRLIRGKEYKFLNNRKDPCIVLFWNNITDYYLRNNIKGLLTVLYHEFGHYKQWLLNEPLHHKEKILPSMAIANNLINDLHYAKEYCFINNKEEGKQ